MLPPFLGRNYLQQQILITKHLRLCLKILSKTRENVSISIGKMVWYHIRGSGLVRMD